jgi:diguanylate cyclase (GGDEF)-like protein
MWHGLTTEGHWYGELWNRRKNGDLYAEFLTIGAVHDEAGRLTHYVALLSDITAIKDHERQLDHVAHYDALTGLPNRVLLADRLRQAMAQSVRRRQKAAVVYLDLDGFKAINDTYGHQVGDRLLTRLAGQMKQALREGDTLARLGGDEFVAVLLDLEDIQSALPMLGRLLAAASQPMKEEGATLQVSASLGVTFFPQADDVDADHLLRQADQAMYQAKLAGKNCYRIFDTDHDRALRGYHESLDRIRQGIARREFVMYYQPKVNMHTGAVIGAEALIRWQHPERGLLPPGAFLGVIEEHPLSIELGYWVLDTALTQIETWKRAGRHIPVSVNVGALQLQQADFVDRLHDMLKAHPNVNPGDLELEVLETSALQDVAQVSKVMRACRAIGVAFALDDFGTGYSSLTYLKRLPASQLKIDQSFVRDMLIDPEDLAILEGVLGLARAFRRQAIAEGVETVEHGKLLLKLGCELGQGYAIARPMPAEDIPRWAAQWLPEVSWLRQAPMNSADLPIIFAAVEHRNWVALVESHLRGEREAPPEDHLACRFGRWLYGNGKERYGDRSAFRYIEVQHRKVHERALELMRLKEAGQGEEALARTAELEALRDTLLDHLDILAQGD